MTYAITRDIKRTIKGFTKARKVDVTYFPELVVAVTDNATSWVAFVPGDNDELAFRSADNQQIIVPLSS